MIHPVDAIVEYMRRHGMSVDMEAAEMARAACEEHVEARDTLTAPSPEPPCDSSPSPSS